MIHRPKRVIVRPFRGQAAYPDEAICNNPRSVTIWHVWSQRAPDMARVTTSNSAHGTDWPFRELPLLGLPPRGTLCDWRAQETRGVTGHWSGRRGFPGAAPLLHKNQGDPCHGAISIRPPALGPSLVSVKFQSTPPPPKGKDSGSQGPHRSHSTWTSSHPGPHQRPSFKQGPASAPAMTGLLLWESRSLCKGPGLGLCGGLFSQWLRSL